MITWSVDVAGVRDVVSTQSAAAEELSTPARQLTAALSDAVRACSGCDDVGGAIDAFVAHHDASVGRIQSTIGAVLDAAGMATAAFVVGDEEMVDNAYRAAAHPVPVASSNGAR